MVWVAGLKFGIVSLPVGEGFVLPPSTAAVVAVAGGCRGAIDELLLGEGEEITSVDLVNTFEGSSGGEGPA